MSEIGISEFNRRMSHFIRRVEQGEVITVTRRGQPVARLIPMEVPDNLVELVADGRIRWAGGTRPPLPKPVKLRGSGMTAAEYVSEGRR